MSKTSSLPGSNSPCFVRLDIRRNIRVTIDILVEFYPYHHGYSCSPMDIRVALYGYPCRIIRASIDILMDLHGKLGISTRISTRRGRP